MIDLLHRVRTFSIGLVALLTAAAGAAAQPADDLPGMPPLLDRQDVYAGARPGRFSANVQGFPDRVYVPNSVRNTVQVIDPPGARLVPVMPCKRGGLKRDESSTKKLVVNPRPDAAICDNSRAIISV